MRPALVLTQEKADLHGYAGPGPFTLAGAFPGVFLIGRPVALAELGFDGEDDARAAFDEAFADAPDGGPLEWTEVGEDEGYAIRDNHALSEAELRADEAERGATTKAGGTIRSHAEADAVAEDLGITFPTGKDRPTVAEKIEAIEQVRAGQPVGDDQALTPEPGAEETTPSGAGEAGQTDGAGEADTQTMPGGQSELATDASGDEGGAG